MLDEAQKTLETLFKSEHIVGNPFYNKVTGNWHIELSSGEKFRTTDLLLVQISIDHLNGEQTE